MAPTPAAPLLLTPGCRSRRREGPTDCPRASWSPSPQRPVGRRPGPLQPRNSEVDSASGLGLQFSRFGSDSSELRPRPRPQSPALCPSPGAPPPGARPWGPAPNPGAWVLSTGIGHDLKSGQFQRFVWFSRAVKEFKGRANWVGSFPSVLTPGMCRML